MAVSRLRTCSALEIKLHVQDQKFHHVIKNALFLTLSCLLIYLCVSTELRGYIYICTNLVLKSIFGLEIYTLNHKHVAHCSTTGLSDEIIQ